jgi:hypothetical protein
MAGTIQRKWHTKKGASDIPGRFQDIDLLHTLPAKGTDKDAELVLRGPAAETIHNILVWSGGSEDDPSDGFDNAWNIFIGGGAALTMQKMLKAEMESVSRKPTDDKPNEDYVEDNGEALELVRELALSGVPKVKVREAGERKRAKATVKALREQQEAVFAAIEEEAEELTPEEAAFAERIKAKIAARMAQA